ncbi:hypothetical protein Tco_0780712 [Tanacetum coccineum]
MKQSSVLRQNATNEAKRSVLRQNATNEAKRSVLRQNAMNESKTQVSLRQHTQRMKQNAIKNTPSVSQNAAKKKSPNFLESYEMMLKSPSNDARDSSKPEITLLKNNFKKEESRNIDREIALEKKTKQLDNIVYKRDQSAQTKAQQLEPKLYDGNVIKNTSVIVIPDSEETLMLAEENPNPSCRPTKVEVPKELPKVSMVNMSLKKLKHHLAGFDVVVKERTTATAITEGSWGFEHTKACFRDEIIPFVKALKDLFNTFDQYLIDELSKVQNVFHQMEQAVEQHRLE